MKKPLLWLVLLGVLVASPWASVWAQEPSEEPAAKPAEVPPVPVALTPLGKDILDDTVAANQRIVEWTADPNDARANFTALACFASLKAPNVHPPVAVVLAKSKRSLEVALDALAAPYEGFGQSKLVNDFSADVDILKQQVAALDATTELMNLEAIPGLVEDLVGRFPLDPAVIEKEYRQAKQKWKKEYASELKLDAKLVSAAEDRVIADVNRTLVPLWNHRVNADAKPVYKAAEQQAKTAQQQYNEALSSVRTEFIKALGCDRGDMLCFDARGAVIADGLDSPIRAGTQFEALVFGEVGKYDDYTVKLDVTEIKEISVVIEQEQQQAGAEGLSNACKTLVPEDQVGFEVLHAQTFTVPTTLGVIDIAVAYTLSKAGKNGATGLHVIQVDHGKYYLHVGLFVPFVPFGNQTVTTRPIGDERYLVLDSDLHVTAGLAMNVFPGGRRRGELTPWSNRARCSTRPCHAAVAGELIGLQIGADLDVRDPIDQFYFGLVFEPVTGLTLSLGAAVMALDEFGPGRYEGQLVGSDNDLEPATTYHVRPYASFGLAFDLVQAINAARQRFVAQKP